jgi:DNA-binding response OmpR family regulator
MKILVVDDEEGARELFFTILTDEGYDVTLANGGQEALTLFQNGQFDLVVTDIKMPGMDGLQLLQEIRKGGSKVDVIMVTAYGEVETYLKAMSLGAAEYINKPIRIKELKRIVHKVLTEKKARSGS